MMTNEYPKAWIFQRFLNWLKYNIYPIMKLPGNIAILDLKLVFIHSGAYIGADYFDKKISCTENILDE